MPLQMSHELCVAHLNPGGCSRGRLCSKRHDIWRCGCGLVLLNLNYGSHMNGARHRKLLREAQKSAGVNTTDGMPIVSIHSYLWTLCNDSGNRSRSLSCVLNVAIMCSSQICQLTMPNIKEWLTRNPYETNCKTRQRIGTSLLSVGRMALISVLSRRQGRAHAKSNFLSQMVMVELRSKRWIYVLNI